MCPSPWAWRTYLVCTLEFPSQLGAGDVERVVVGQVRGVVPPLHNKRVGGASLEGQLRNEGAVDVPRYAPTSQT